MTQYCRECGLPVTEYRQFVQEEHDICEFCVAAALGATEFTDEEDPND